MLSICALSDTHGDLPEMEEPCELVLIAGDISPLKIQRNVIAMRYWLYNKFLPWANNLPCDKVLFIGGNHECVFPNLTDFLFSVFSKDKKVAYLYHENYIYTSRDGKEYSIFGTPFCRVYGTWAFMEMDSVLDKLYGDIPEGLDILLSHDAPYGYADICTEYTPWNTGEHLGNKPLASAILKKQPRYVFRGHLHSTQKVCYINNTKCYNVSIKNEEYEAVYPLTCLEI